jgi:starch-binding outer membrane protein, SusD/RagB family
MKSIRFILTISILFAVGACENNVLEPEPIDVVINDVVLNEAKDIPNVEIGLYSAFRGMTNTIIIAGDLTADNLIHIGTFSQYRELGIKKITAANASVATLWSNLYSTIYIANFMLERLPTIPGVPTATRTKAEATARYIRGMCYFIGAYTFGAFPLVTTTDIEVNRNIARTSRDEILAFAEADLISAAGQLPLSPPSPAFASEYAVRAALARFYLFQQNWAAAEANASIVINSGSYQLDDDYTDIVYSDFPAEAIFEVGYTIADDPATLNTLFKSRREIVPSNQQVVALASAESGDRLLSMEFDIDNLKGNDNGWEVAKYGTAVDDNNNIMVFRLAEMYLIRAEARAHLGNTTGANSAQSDVNLLRDRANAPLVGDVSQTVMLRLVEEERRYELAFEGHRWYDLVRTGRASTVMPAFNANWRDAYNLWPVPQREIQTNPSLQGDQNPGY